MATMNFVELYIYILYYEIYDYRYINYYNNVFLFYCSYTLIIEAADMVGTLPARTGTVTITIDVDDLNDNVPEWGGATYHLTPFVGYDVSLSEDIAAGSIAIDIDATDADIDDNARLSYDIVSGNDDLHFTIDPDFGV